MFCLYWSFQDDAERKIKAERLAKEEADKKARADLLAATAERERVSRDEAAKSLKQAVQSFKFDYFSDFVAAVSFHGRFGGYVFKNGDKGNGYYRQAFTPAPVYTPPVPPALVFTSSQGFSFANSNPTPPPQPIRTQNSSWGSSQSQRQEPVPLKSNRHPNKKRSDSISPPEEYCCSISLELMIDPVIASDGFSYERVRIAQWIQKCKADGRIPTSPKTGHELEHEGLVGNRNLLILINDFRSKNNLDKEEIPSSAVVENDTDNSEDEQLRRLSNRNVSNQQQQRQGPGKGKKGGKK